MCDKLSVSPVEQMDTCEYLAAKNEDHECDSNFAMRRHKPVQTAADENTNGNEDDESALEPGEIVKVKVKPHVPPTPPLIIQKQSVANTHPPKMMLVKAKPKSPLVATTSSPLKQPKHLDNIVNTLKINIMQQLSKATSLQENANTAKCEDKKEVKIESPQKRHELFIKIVEGLKQAPANKLG